MFPIEDGLHWGDAKPKQPREDARRGTQPPPPAVEHAEADAMNEQALFPMVWWAVLRWQRSRH